MKGASQVISIVILLGALIGVGTLIMKFSTQYTKESIEDISSPAYVDPFASLDIKSVTSTQILVENTGQKTLKNFKVYVDGTRYQVSSAPSELQLSQPAIITLSQPVPPGTHTIYVLTDKSKTKGTFEIPSKELLITNFQDGTGYHVNTTSGLKLAYQ